MKGVLVRLKADSTGKPSMWFGRVFSPIVTDLDRMRWLPSWQPWMGPPDCFAEKEALWRSGSLRRYSRYFAEEYIELHGFIPPVLLSPDPAGASAVLRYTDRACWEFYSNFAELFERVYDHAQLDASLQPVWSESDHRGQAFGQAGLSTVWRNLNRRI